jgi:hypothetical protein
MYNQNVQLWRFARTAELSVIEIGSADDWQDHPDCPHRVVFGQDRVVQCRDGGEVTVSTSCIQFSDGSIDIGGLLETPGRPDRSAAIQQRCCSATRGGNHRRRRGSSTGGTSSLPPGRVPGGCPEEPAAPTRRAGNQVVRVGRVRQALSVVVAATPLPRPRPSVSRGRPEAQLLRL